MVGGRFDVISEIGGHSITAIITPQRGRVLLATEQGNVFESRIEPDGSRHTQPLLTQSLESADREPRSSGTDKSVDIKQQTLCGSLSRGVLAIQDGQAREMEIRSQRLLCARVGN